MYKNRPLWSIAAEVIYQYLFYSSALWNPRDFMWWLAARFDYNYSRMLIVVTCLVLTLSWIIPSICMIAIYKANHPFFERYKIQEWVWEKPDSLRKKQYYALFHKTVEAFIVTQIIVCAAVYYSFSRITETNTTEDYVKYLNETPQGLEAFPKFLFCLFFFETCFYWGHRFLHTRIGYRFHKDHHAYYTPISNAGNWGHLVDGILSLPFPAIFPVMFFDLHIYTIWQWAIIHILHSQYDHCGYDFPFSFLQLIPFGSHTDAHNFHHSHVLDNYGLYFRFWDYVMGTNKHWNRFCEERERQIEEAKKHGGAGADLLIKEGQVLVKNIGEMRDVKDGTDNLSFTFVKHNMIKLMNEKEKAMIEKGENGEQEQEQEQVRGQKEGQGQGQGQDDVVYTTENETRTKTSRKRDGGKKSGDDESEEEEGVKSKGSVKKPSQKGNMKKRTRI